MPEADQNLADPIRGSRSGIGSETRGLVDDVKKWVDLKVQLLQIDLEVRLEGMLNRLAVSAVMAVMVLLTALFGLFTIAFSLGSWWYSDALGFLAVTLLLAISTVTFYAMRPTLVKLRRLRDAEDVPELLATGQPPEIAAPDPGSETGPPL